MKKSFLNFSTFLLIASSLIPLSIMAAESSTGANDTLFDKQWSLENTGQTILRRSGELTRDRSVGIKGIDIDWVDLSKATIPEDREIVVAVLDSGVDVNHPDLKGKIFYNKKLCPEDEDNSKKACVGFNVLKRNTDVTDDKGHGTHVAGIIGAVGRNGLGIKGASDPRVKIMPVKIISNETNGFIYDRKLITDLFADGILFAVNNGAHVINMSLGYPKVVETKRMKNALTFAASKNVVVIAAAGNNNKQIPTYPCTSPSVICVGAIDNQGKVTEFSNFGGKVDIAAPGEFIVSTYPMEDSESRILRIRGYEAKNGTSQASPFVAAIVANLKLTNPDMSVDEIKARLYSSSKEVASGDDKDKFFKYGRVSMQGALAKAPETFIEPIFKDLLDVNFDKLTGVFQFALPIKSLMKEERDLSIRAYFENKNISIESETQSLSLAKGEQRSLLIKGRVIDLNKDSQYRLSVEVKTKSGKEFKAQTTVIFARDLSREALDGESFIEEELEGFKASELMFFNRLQKALKVKPIINKESWLETPGFYLQTKELQSADKTGFSVLKREKGKWIREDHYVDKLFELVSVEISDLDMDGVYDYLVYGVNEDQTQLTFDYLMRKGDGSIRERKRFTFALLDFVGFPLDYTEMANFDFFKISHNGKNLKVPTYFVAYKFPEEDNSEDVLERISDYAIFSHIYYLLPNNKNQFDLRVIDSFTMREKVKLKFEVEPWLGINFEKPFPQTADQRREGLVRGFVTAGEEFLKNYYYYEIQDRSKSFSEVTFSDRLIAGNTIRSVLEISGRRAGELSSQVNFMAQLSRDQIRSYMWSEAENMGSSLEIDSGAWSDPIFNSVSSFNDPQRTRFIETRYFLRFFDQLGQTGQLRINRESSFPGVQFSETLKTVVVNQAQENLPGIFINSTLIFGNRLYTMVKKDGNFIRPALLSVDIPANCVHMNPGKVDGEFNYLMLCRESDERATLKRMPMRLPEAN